MAVNYMLALYKYGVPTLPVGLGVVAALMEKEQELDHEISEAAVPAEARTGMHSPAWDVGAGTKVGQLERPLHTTPVTNAPHITLSETQRHAS